MPDQRSSGCDWGFPAEAHAATVSPVQRADATTTRCNERLRETLLSLGESPADFAAKLGVDPKTVERWISNATRNPHPRVAYHAARLLDVEVAYLWPNLHNRRASKISGSDELTACWPGRAAVPAEVWTRLFSNAQGRINIMGDFGLSEVVPDLPRLLVEKTIAGVQVRVIITDPATATNPIDLARAHEAEAVYLPLAEQGVAVGRYPGRMATAILRVDDHLIVRTGIDGCPAAFAPVIQLRALPNGPLSRLYLTSLDIIAETAMPTVLRAVRAASQ